MQGPDNGFGFGFFLECENNDLGTIRLTQITDSISVFLNIYQKESNVHKSVSSSLRGKKRNNLSVENCLQ